MDIVILRRRDDYISFLYGYPDIWEAGETEEVAIGKLMISLYNHKGFNIMLTRRLSSENRGE